MAKSQGFGATGNFPRGRLNENDAGELRFGIAADREHGVVILDFGTNVRSLGMPPDLAIKLAISLIQNAQKVSKELVTIELPLGDLEFPIGGEEGGDRS